MHGQPNIKISLLIRTVTVHAALNQNMERVITYRYQLILRSLKTVGI
jgi:hypothetical protein